MDCLSDLVRVVNESAVVNVAQTTALEDGSIVVKTYDWQEYFTTYQTIGVRYQEAPPHQIQRRSSRTVTLDSITSSIGQTPVRAELGVTYHNERQCDLCVETGHHSPEQVLDHDGILVLPTTVIGVQVHPLLTQSMMC